MTLRNRFASKGEGHHLYRDYEEDVMGDEKVHVKAKGAALLPFILFVLVYLATGLILNAMGVEMAFYQVAAPVCILPAEKPEQEVATFY